MEKNKFHKMFPIIIVLVCFSISSILASPYQDLISSDKYITTEDGVIRLYVNIIGHVKKPGTYLVYDGIDIMTALSSAGGYLNGANLSNITIYKSNGTKSNFNLKKILDSEESLSEKIILDPHDTIYIDESISNKIFSSSNLPYIIISLINLAITLENVKD